MNDLRLVLSAAVPYRLGPAGGVALMPCESALVLALPGFLPRWVRISNGGKPVKPGMEVADCIGLTLQGRGYPGSHGTRKGVHPDID